MLAARLRRLLVRPNFFRQNHSFSGLTQYDTNVYMMGMMDNSPLRAVDPALARTLTLGRLADQLQKLERGSHPVRGTGDTISSGIETLDRLLPDAGFRGGTLIEWVAGKGSADQLVLWRPARLSAKTGC